MIERVAENVSLAAYTTLGVGGVARYFIELREEKELPGVAAFVAEKNVPLSVLGGGSNILFADGMINAVVLKNELQGITVVSKSKGLVLVRVAAGEVWDNFVSYAVKKGWFGVEKLSGIPGTVGAVPVQNINAYGASVATAIESVKVFDLETRKFKTVSAAACRFGYRDSLFKHEEGKRFIITAVSFSLTTVPDIDTAYRSASQSIAKYLADKNITAPTAIDIRKAVLFVRGNIGMLPGMFQSAGSFFKNTVVGKSEFARIQGVVEEKFSELDDQYRPWYWELPDGQVKISTAFLLECSPYNKTTYGQKRWRGVVGISLKHSLSIVTEAGATASDVLEFVSIVVSSVQDIFGIEIEPEVNVVE